MSDINDKYRPELKSYFLAYSIPTQQNFEDLIDAMIIQGEDPIAINSESPLMIRTSGDDQNREEFIRFSTEFGDENPWVLAQNPYGTTGFEIAAGGETRLFINKSNGSLGVNTRDPRGQLDVETSDNDIAPLVIARGATNCLSVSSLNDNAKMVIGGQLSDFTDDITNKAKLHVTLGADDISRDVKPLVIDGTGANDYLSISSDGEVGINTAADYPLDEQLNVRGNIKAGKIDQLFFLKNNNSDGDPTFISTGEGKWLQLVSQNALAFWANSAEPTDRSNPNLLISSEDGYEGNVGIGFALPKAKLSVNGSLYIGADDASHNPGSHRLEVGGNTKIDGNMEVTGTGSIGDITISGSSVATSGTLLLSGSSAVHIYNSTTMEVNNNEVRIGNNGGDNSRDLYLNGDMYVNSTTTPIDFNKITTIEYVDFKELTIPAFRGKSGGSTATNNAVIDFKAPILGTPQAMLKSWHVFYDKGGDHHYKRSQVEITGVNIEGTKVRVYVRCRLTDGGNRGPWGADVKVVVIAKVQK